jgi:hypothetical protein
VSRSRTTLTSPDARADIPIESPDDGGYAVATSRSIARSCRANISLVFFFSAGMDGFVGKPFKIAEIIDKMIELAPKKIITTPW